MSTRALLFLVVRDAGVFIGHAVSQRRVQADGELPHCGGDGCGLTHSGGSPSVAGPQSGTRPANMDGGQTKEVGGTACMAENQQHWPVAVGCEVLGGSRSGLYAYQRRPAVPARSGEESDLLARLKAIADKPHDSDGSRRLTKHLQDEG